MYKYSEINVKICFFFFVSFVSLLLIKLTFYARINHLENLYFHLKKKFNIYAEIIVKNFNKHKIY